ncbi:MAG: hypothetical protein AAGL10_09110 [Pseudomonadota bacterium]
MAKRKPKQADPEHSGSVESEQKPSLPLPSTSPSTNAIVTGLLVSGAGQILLDQLEKRMIVAAYDPDKARDLVDGRTIVKSLALYGASKLATRSVPGLAIVAGGLLVKSLYDRGRTVQRERREKDSGEQ